MPRLTKLEREAVLTVISERLAGDVFEFFRDACGEDDEKARSTGGCARKGVPQDLVPARLRNAAAVGYDRTEELMDDELKQYLAGLEKRFSEHLDGRLDALEVRLQEHTAQSIEGMETRLLSAFHGWAGGMEVRVNGSMMLMTGLDTRLASVEHRLRVLESKQGN